MSELVRLQGREIETSTTMPLPGMTAGDDVQLRFAAAGWNELYKRQMPFEGVCRVLGLKALGGDGFGVQFDTDNGFERGEQIGTPTLQRAIGIERKRKGQAPQGNALAAVLINGEAAWHRGRRTALDSMSNDLGATREYAKRDGAAVARACREGDLRWADVPKGMPVGIRFGKSVYYASESPDYIPRTELVTHAIHLRSLGEGVFKVAKSMSMTGVRRNEQLDAWEDILRPGMRVSCYSGEGQSELALARASLTIAAGNADNRSDAQIAITLGGQPHRLGSVRRPDIAVQATAVTTIGNGRELARGALYADSAEAYKSTRVLDIDFGGVSASMDEHDDRQTMRERVKAESARSAWSGTAVLDGHHGGFAVTD